MRKIVLALFILFLTGCASKTVIEEYNAGGAVIKRTETSESMVKAVINGCKDKTIVMWSSGWSFHITSTISDAQNPTPTFKIFMGNINTGFIAANPNDKNIDKLPAVITASKSNIGVVATKSGISAKNK